MTLKPPIIGDHELREYDVYIYSSDLTRALAEQPLGPENVEQVLDAEQKLFWRSGILSGENAPRFINVEVSREAKPWRTAVSSDVDLASFMAPLIGCYVRIYATGRYRLSAKSLPSKSIIGAMSISTEVYGSSATVTGASLEFGEPDGIRELQWTTKGDILDVELVVSCDIKKIESDFFVTVQSALRACIERYVFGKMEHDKP